LPPTDESTCASKRGRHLYEGHAAHVAGGGETRHVTDHSAAERVQDRLAVATVAEQRIKDQVQGSPGLERLAIGQNHLMDPGVSSGQRIGQVPRVQRSHGGIAHNDGRGRWGRFGEGGRIT
jgi:hypothetical protein